MLSKSNIISLKLIKNHRKNRRPPQLSLMSMEKVVSMGMAKGESMALEIRTMVFSCTLSLPV